MPRKAYQLLRNGIVVRTHQVTGTTPQGRITRLTRGKIGHAGEVYETLAQSTIDQIEAGDLSDTWKIIELPDEGEQAEEEALEGPESVDQPEELEPDPDLHVHGEVAHAHRMDFNAMTHRTLMGLVAEHEMQVEGTGASGSVTKSDAAQALVSAHQEPVSEQP